MMMMMMRMMMIIIILIVIIITEPLSQGFVRLIYFFLFQMDRNHYTAIGFIS